MDALEKGLKKIGINTVRIDGGTAQVHCLPASGFHANVLFHSLIPCHSLAAF